MANFTVTVKHHEGITDVERRRRLAAAYNVVLTSFRSWAEARLAEIEEELTDLAGDPARWRERLQLRRERRRLRRLLHQGGGS